MANKVYIASETVKTFKDTGGDVTWTLANLANAAGRISAQLDLGANSRSGIYQWMFRYTAAVNPTVGLGVNLYAVFSDGTDVAGGLGTSDAAIATETILTHSNAQFIAPITANEASTSRAFTRFGTLWIPTRYVSFAVWNALGQALTNTAGNHYLKLTPIPDEIQ